MLLIVKCMHPDDGDKPTPELVEIPDTNFRAALKDNIPDAFPEGGDKIDPNSGAVKGCRELIVHHWQIHSIKGIEYFTKLEKLNCFCNLLTNLDLTRNTLLTYLDCGDNKLTALNLKQNVDLHYLRCDKNHQITTLDLSHNPYLNKDNVIADEGVKITWYEK